MNKAPIIRATLALVVFCLGGKGLAQEPIVHTVDFPKGDAAWSITFALDQVPGQPPAPKPRDRQPAKLDVVRKGSLRHDLMTWSDGGVTESWWNENPAFVLTQDGPDGRITVMKTGNMNDARCDETLFAWIAADTFLDIREFQHKSCRYYEKKIVLPNGDKALLRGWIENKTALPVGWSMTGVLSIFSFDVPLPPEPLVLPQKFQAAMARMQNFFVFPKRTPAPGT